MTTQPQAQAPTAPPQYSPDGRFYWNGYQWQPVTPPAQPYAPYAATPWGQPPVSASSNRISGFTAGACACGLVALLFFPIILGPTGIVLGAIGMSRREKYAGLGLGVAIGGMLIGFMLGYYVATH